MDMKIYNCQTKEWQTLEELEKWYKDQEDLSFYGFYDNGYSYCCSLKTENFEVISKEYKEAVDYLASHELKKGYRATFLDYISIRNKGNGAELSVCFTQTSTYKRYSEVSNS